MFDTLWELPGSLPTCVGTKRSEGFKTLLRHNQCSHTLPSTVPVTPQQFFSLIFISFPFPTCHCGVTTVSSVLVQARRGRCAPHGPLAAQGPGGAGADPTAQPCPGARGTRNPQHTRHCPAPGSSPHLSGATQRPCFG